MKDERKFFRFKDIKEMKDEQRFFRLKEPKR